MRNYYDVVIIGSGFGGAVAACRLAQSGRSVAVLERGRRWRGDDFPRTIGQVAEAFWSEGRSHGFLEYLAFRGVDVIQGSGVGGGSLHYFNVNLRCPPAVFGHAPWPEAITADTLAPFYEPAEEMLGSSVLVPPPGRDTLPARTRAFIDASVAAGYPVELVPIAVHAAAPRKHPLTGMDQQPCTYCGNCLFGCQVHAKNTLDRNYLAIAEHQHGAEIFPLHIAESIARRSDGGYDVVFRALDDNPTSPPQPGRIRAGSVVVAAGSLGSTKLLLSCRDRTRTLPDLSSSLGGQFCVNGEFLFGAALEAAERTDPGVGPPITARVTMRLNGHLMTVQDLGLPDSLLWFLEGVLPGRRRRMWGLLELALDYAGRTLGRRPTSGRPGLDVSSLVAGGRTPHAVPFLGMGTDQVGWLRLRGEELDVTWSARRNRELYRAMQQMMSEISGGAGGRFVTSFLWRWPFRKILTAHPLGGCPMGDDPRTSVVDDRCEVWGHPGLFVMDGSVVPGPLAVNPSLTIAAVAERATAHLIAR